jgi:hypothetical protein
MASLLMGIGEGKTARRLVPATVISHVMANNIAPRELLLIFVEGQRLLEVFFRDGFLGVSAIESHVGQEQQPIVLLPGS